MRMDKIEGNYVNIRVAEIEDAGFSLSVRQLGNKTQFIPKLTISIDEQKEWIKKQLVSEDCYFCIIERKDKTNIGTYSLYNISKDKKECEAGRLVMIGDQIESLETGFLLLKFAFEKVGIVSVQSDVEKENISAIGFTKHLGGKVIKEYTDLKTNKKMIEFLTVKEDFDRAAIKLKNIIDHFVKSREKK